MIKSNLVFLCLASQILSSFAFPTGAPLSACLSSSLSNNGITPGHSTQSSDISHLSIAISSSDGSNNNITKILSGVSYLITLSSNDVTLPFKGFALGSYDGADGSRLKGSYSAISSGHDLVCSQGAIITHSDNTLKTSVTAVWTAPSISQLSSTLYFESTVVDSYAGNYYFVQSNMLTSDGTFVDSGSDGHLIGDYILFYAPVGIAVLSIIAGVLINHFGNFAFFKRYILHAYVNITVGGLMFWGAWLAGWICFFYYIFSSTSPDIGKSSGLGVAMSLGLTLVPISRTSLWVRVFHIPFDKAVKFHIIFGCSTLICGILHVVRVVTLINGDVSIIFTTSYKDGSNYVPLSGFIALLMISIMYLISLIRRSHWEIFYTIHVTLAMCVFIAVLVHTTAGGHYWYYVPGVLIYSVDLFYRLLDSTKKAEIVELSVMNDITNLKLRVSTHSFFKNSDAGSYAFLCIPEIDYFFHPFTIASPPQEENLTFHIKSNGGKTWTAKLHEIAEIASNNPRSAATLTSNGHDKRSSSTLPPISNKMPKVMIYGPYGKLNVKLDESALVVMVAGGIGITPFLSIYKDLKFKKEKSLLPKNKKVVLIWFTRGNLHLIEDLKDEENSPNLDLGFTVVAFNTSNKKDVAIPKLPELLKKYTQDFTPNEVSVLACGPRGLVFESQHLSMANNFHFHKEVFEL